MYVCGMKEAGIATTPHPTRTPSPCPHSLYIHKRTNQTTNSHRVLPLLLQHRAGADRAARLAEEGHRGAYTHVHTHTHIYIVSCLLCDACGGGGWPPAPSSHPPQTPPHQPTNQSPPTQPTTQCNNTTHTDNDRCTSRRRAARRSGCTTSCASSSSPRISTTSPSSSRCGAVVVPYGDVNGNCVCLCVCTCMYVCTTHHATPHTSVVRTLNHTTLHQPNTQPKNQVLAWDRAMAVWESARYWGHILTLAAFAVTSVMPAGKKADGGKKKKA